MFVSTPDPPVYNRHVYPVKALTLCSAGSREREGLSALTGAESSGELIDTQTAKPKRNRKKTLVFSVFLALYLLSQRSVTRFISAFCGNDAATLGIPGVGGGLRRATTRTPPRMYFAPVRTSSARVEASSSVSRAIAKICSAGAVSIEMLMEGLATSREGKEDAIVVGAFATCKGSVSPCGSSGLTAQGADSSRCPHPF